MLLLAQSYLESRRNNLDPGSAATEAWDRFFQAYAPLIKRQVRRCLRRGLSREDCVQEIWRVFLTGFPRFSYDPDRGQFDAWMKTVVRRLAADFATAAERAEASPLAAITESRLVDDHLDPAAACERRQLLTTFWTCMEELKHQLPATKYQAFELRFLQRRTVKEISAQLGLAPSEARDIFFRTKLRLRQLLQSQIGKDVC